MASTSGEEHPSPDEGGPGQATDSNPDGVVPARSLTPLVVLAGVALVVLLVIFNLAGGDDSDSADADGEAGLAQFQFESPSGDPVTFAAYEGQPLVINYFASWCAPCRAELPHFETVSNEVAESGVTFVGVSRDNDTSSWLALVEDTGVTFDTMFEGNNAGSFDYVNALAMPTTVFVQADGTVSEVFSGVLPESTLRDKINEHFTEG